MLIKARIPYPCEVPLVWLPLDRIARELFLLVFQREQILENIHHRFLPGQAALAIEQKVPKFGIVCFVQPTRFTDSLKDLMHQCWFRLHAFDPAEYLGGAMTAILPFLMRHAPLEIVISHPFVVDGEQIFPGVRFFKTPIRHTPLDTNYVELTEHLQLFKLPNSCLEEKPAVVRKA